MGNVLMTKENAMKGNHIMVDYVDCYPSDTYPNAAKVHSHEFYEIEWILSGEGTVHINSIPLDVGEGTFYVICPGEYHTYSLRTDKRLVMYNLKFNASAVNSQILDELETTSAPRVSRVTQAYKDKLDYEVKLLAESIPENGLMTRNAMERILIIILTILRESEPENAIREIEQIRRITDYVSQNYKNKISLSDVARIMNLSENYLGIYFKKHTGQCFSDYVRDVRVCRAAQLLCTTRLSVKEVAYRTGFCSSEYLSRSFKSFFGASPIEYRKKHKGT